MRNAAEAISRLLGYVDLGKVLAKFFRKVLRESAELRTLVVVLGSGFLPEDILESLTRVLDGLLVPARRKFAKISRAQILGQCATMSATPDCPQTCKVWRAYSPHADDE